MYLFTVTMFPNEQNKKDGYEEFRGEQDWYFGALSKNGQILISSCNTVFEDDTYKTFLLAPEQDSLDSKYANKYVNEFYMKLMNLCIREPEIRIVGRSSDFELSCNCVSPSWYMLYSDHTITESPIVCGDCGRTVPLYKLPKILGEDEYYTVLGWQRAYNACDNLFLEGIAERMAYNRLSKPESDLSKEGREICQAFENKTGKPFYYYLFRYYARYYSTKKQNCPICGSEWRLDEDNTTFIDYRCDNCRLVADVVNRNR
ncbi:DUF2310 family Zn-ribbon-containing protein [Ruminiclostridium cellobioparum]|uniref:DUF2310 family Zn-ribbon-containing protein n=1 Tax=Ruminiclostridium cellobioparum TaxID=29355 RepID=UPI000485D84A|nr:DUF2310 family Zn-ribbon-containing protein [Ruminiclostridium cellobioparum]